MAEGIRPFQNGMRSPLVAPITRGLIAFPLFFLTTHTDKYFAWTIKPALTAAVLGANYIASTVLAILASKKSTWAYGRISISVALVFAPITTAATFIHINKFHLDSFFGWFWVIAYGLYPVMLIFYLTKQLKIPGGDPPRTNPIATWVKAVLAIHAAILIPMGLAMFAATDGLRKLWPWEVTPLTARALSAWALAFGVMGAHAIFENDLGRTKIAFLSYAAFGFTHSIAIARYSGDVQWDEPGAWIYCGLVASTFIIALYGWLASREIPAEPAVATATRAVTP